VSFERIMCAAYVCYTCCTHQYFAVVFLCDSVIYLYMAGPSRDMTQFDSYETQPPDVPFDTQPPQVVHDSQPPDAAIDSSESLLSSRRRLVPGTRDWYVTYTYIFIHNHLYANIYNACTYIFDRYTYIFAFSDTYLAMYIYLISLFARHRFGHQDVVRFISETIKTHYKEPFTCWRDAPEDHKVFWWNCFKVSMTQNIHVRPEHFVCFILTMA